MAGLNARHTPNLRLLKRMDSHPFLGGSVTGRLQTLEKTTDERRMPKKTTSAKSKKKLLDLLNEKHPDWELGKGKGFSISALKNALETGEKPEPKKRKNPYFDFLAIVRKEVADLDLSPKQIVSLGASRWKVLKLFSAENGHTTKDIVNDPELLKQVAANYAPIEEDSKVRKYAKRKEDQEAQEGKKKNEEVKKPENEERMTINTVIKCCGMFCRATKTLTTKEDLKRK